MFLVGKTGFFKMILIPQIRICASQYTHSNPSEDIPGGEHAFQIATMEYPSPYD